MTMILKNIKEFTKEWKARLAENMPEGASLGIVQVGDNEASNRYVRNKLKDCEEVGIKGNLYKFPEAITEGQLIQELIKDEVQNNTGLIVQLPLPSWIDKDRIKEYVPVWADVDGFNADSVFDPCTPLGIVRYLDACGFGYDGAHVVVIGRSDLVGRPMARMMLDRNATVTVCHSRTKNLSDIVHSADLIICAVGKAKFLNCYSIHCPVIDVGINFNDEGKLVGDCFNTEGRDVTPVPGGVGLLTRCALLDNVAKAATHYGVW